MKCFVKIVLFVAFVTANVFSTLQEPDMLEFENNEWRVFINGPTIFDSMSRLPEFRADSNILYPTSLYRGYVAYYKIISDSVYVSKVTGYGNSIGSDINGINGVWAEQYSGIVVAEKKLRNGRDSTLLMKVKNGVVEKCYKTHYLSVEDILNKRVFDDKELDTMIDEYRRYTYYVSNSISQDKAEFKKIEGKLVTVSNDRLLDIYLKNNGKSWGYDWERSDTSGVPVVKVKFANEKMIIDSVFVKTRSNHLISINLDILFSKSNSNNGYLADWYTGFIGMNYYSSDLLQQCGGYVIFDIDRGQIIKTDIIDGKTINKNKSEIMKWTSSLKNKQAQRCIEHYLKSQIKKN